MPAPKNRRPEPDWRIATLLALVSWLPTGTVPLWASDPRLGVLAERTLEDATFRVQSKLLADNKVYPAGECTRRVIRRGASITVCEQARLKIQLPHGVINITNDVTVVEDLQGRVLEFDFIDEDKQICGRAVGGRFEVSWQEGAATHLRKVPHPSDLLTENGNLRKMLREYQAGNENDRPTHWKLKEFYPPDILGDAKVLDFTMLGKETLDFRGQQIEVFKFRQVDRKRNASDYTPMTTNFWVDRNAIMYRLEIEFDDTPTAIITFERVR